MASSIPGLSVSYLTDFDLQKPTKPSIPGLEVREVGGTGGVRNPNVLNGGVGSAEARSVRASLRQPVGIPGLDVIEGAPTRQPVGIPGLDVIEGAPEQPRAPLRQPTPSAGWLRRQAGAISTDVRQSVSNAARRVSQGLAEGSAYLDRKFEPLAGESKGLLRRGVNAAGSAGRYIAGKSGALGAAVDGALGAADVYDYTKTGASSGDVATRAAETAAGVGGAGAGAAAGAAAGAGLGLATGPFAPVAAPVLGLVGGAAGAYLGKEGTGRAIRGLRNVFGLDEDPTRRNPPAAGQPPAAGLRPTAAAPAAPQGPLTPTNAGTDRDLTRELNAVPATLPTDMRPGIVAKTTGPGGRVTYSGTDVRENPSMVDGAGRNLSLRGSFSTLPTAPETASGALPAGGQGVPATPVPSGVAGFDSTGSGNMLGRSRAQLRQDALTQASSIAPGTRALGVRSLDALDRQDLADTSAGATRFAAQTSAEASMANARTAADANRYAADRQVDASMASARGMRLRTSLETQAKLQAQQVMAQAMAQANGDAGQAAQIMASMGYNPETLTQLATNQQARAAKGKDDAESYFRASSVNAENKIDEGLLAQHAEMANQITGGRWAGMTNEQRMQLAPDVVAGVKLLKGINSLRDHELTKAVGLDHNTPAMTNLPDMNGAVIDRVGMRTGLLTNNVASGDYRILTRDGQELFVPGSAVDGGTLSMLERRGAKLNLKD